jgi:hypothetical protein
MEDARDDSAVANDAALAAPVEATSGGKRRRRKKKKKKKVEGTDAGDDGDGIRGPNVIVLGVPRSGTSVVTSTIVAMGASWLGESGVALERPDGATTNPRGFYERHDVFKLNWSFLHKQGIRGPTYFDGPKGDLKKVIVEKMKARAVAIVEDMNAGCRGVQPWVLKLMRYELAHALWSDLDDIRKCVVVVPVRDPIEVKASTWSYWQSLDFWARDTEKILERAARFGHSVVLVSHKELMSSPDVETRRLLHVLQSAGVRGLSLPSTTVVDPSLYRKREDADPTDSLADHAAVQRLWIAVRKLYADQVASGRPIEPDVMKAALTRVAMAGMQLGGAPAATPPPLPVVVTAEVAARLDVWAQKKRAAWEAGDAKLRAKCETNAALEVWIEKQKSKALAGGKKT